jgi:hypothetical protein
MGSRCSRGGPAGHVARRLSPVPAGGAGQTWVRTDADWHNRAIRRAVSPSAPARSALRGNARSREGFALPPLVRLRRARTT